MKLTPPRAKVRGMADLTTLQTRLTEAEGAYHRLLTGSLEESIGLGDMQVRYTRAETDKLARYLGQLRSEIAALGGGGVRRKAFAVRLGGLT